MNSQMEETDEKRPIYAKYRTDNTEEPLLSHKIPGRPWSEVGVDQFTVQVYEYIFIADYYSKYTQVIQLREQTSFAIINKLKSMFSGHGILDILI